MESTPGLQRQVKSVSSLSNLVKSLKVLSAVNMRVFNKSCEALEAYLQNLESGLQVVLRQVTYQPPPTPANSRLVLLGSDHGLCGAFHSSMLPILEQPHAYLQVFCVGSRLAEAAQDHGVKVDSVLSAPTSTAGLAEVADQLLQLLQPLNGSVTMAYHGSNEGLSQPREEILWPVQEAWLTQLRQRRWLAPGERGGLPSCWGKPFQALDWLLEETLVARCQRALAHSLASENQARLQTMQAAEKNLEEMRVSLQDNLQGRRQNAVTEELLDVIAGFEMLKEGVH